MPDEKKLLPCPFCGRTPKITKGWLTQDQRWVYDIQCCIVHIDSAFWSKHTVKTITEHWNLRADTKEIAPSASDNTDYAAANRVWDDYITDPNRGLMDFRPWLKERLHAEERHDA